MKKRWDSWKVLYILIASLYGINAVAGNIATTRAQIALVYYKDFPAGAIKNNAPVPGCILKANAGKLFWHCRERVYLLRSLTQVASLKQKQHRLTFNSFALDPNHTEAQIISVHLLKKPRVLPGNNFVPVTGIFITHSFKVKQYQFKNSGTGHISNIRATRDHPFYTETSHSFIPVSRVSSTDHLLNDKQETVHLLCPANRTSHCGIPVAQSLPIQVYNLETDKKHTFYAGKEKIFVHNCTDSSAFSPTLPYSTPVSTLGVDTKSKEERELLGTLTRRLLRSTISEKLKQVRGAEDFKPETIAYYTFHGTEVDNSSGVLFRGTNKSRNTRGVFVKQTPTNIVNMMRRADEFEKAETVFIINSAPATKEEAISRDLAGYFRQIANISNKNVIYNTKNSVATSFSGHILCDLIGDYEFILVRPH